MQHPELRPLGFGLPVCRKSEGQRTLKDVLFSCNLQPYLGLTLLFPCLCHDAMPPRARLPQAARGVLSFRKPRI